MNDKKALEVSVNGKPTYKIEIGGGLIFSAGTFIRENMSIKRAYIIADENAAARWLVPLKESLSVAKIMYSTDIIASGEASKSIEMLSSIYERMAMAKIDRHDCIIALGGGVTGDVAGFAAATYMRGIPCVMVPTTLLSQVDSSIGGKTAINISVGKNLVGLFYQPALVIADTDTLMTLNKREYNSGMAEVIKYACICDAPLLNILSSGNFDVDDIVERSLSHKKVYVESDERDNGVRRELNFGHTIGHAAEAASGYALLHGEAVAAGMYYEALLGERMGITENGTADKIKTVLVKFDLKSDIALERESIMREMIHDKKADGDFVDIVLLERIGNAVITRVKFSELENMLWK